MGYCPDWYEVIQVAKYLGCKVWELEDQPMYWHQKALIAMEAEAQAQKIKNQNGK